MQPFTPEIQEPVFQPGLFRAVFLNGNLEGKRVSETLHCERLGQHFDFSGRQSLVDRILTSGHHGAGHRDHAFRPDLLAFLEEGAIRGDHHLSLAIMVT